MAGLCKVASIIHEACTALKNQYSRALIRRWLPHGHEGKGLSLEQPVLNEGNIVDFVLDLNMAMSKTALY